MGSVGATAMRETDLDNKLTQASVAIEQLLATVDFLQVTLVLDDWTDINNPSVRVIIALLPSIGPLVLETINASAESHTGDK